MQPPPYDGDEEEEKFGSPIDPRRVVRSLLGARWILLGAIVLGGLIGLPVAKFVIQHEFKATAMLQYEGTPPIEGVSEETTDEQNLGAKLQTIFIDSVLGDIRNRMGIEDPNFVLAQRIHAEADQAQVVRITGSATSAADASRLANMTSAAFRDHQLAAQRGRVQEAIDGLQQRISAADAAAETARTAYDNFRNQHGVADLSTEQEQAIEQAADVRAQRDRKESEVRALEARIETLQTTLRSTPRTVTMTSTMASGEAGELSRLRGELRTARASLSDDHPRVQALRRQIQQLEARVNSGEGTTMSTSSSTNSRYTQIESALMTARADLSAARQALEGLTTQAQQAQERVSQFSNIEGDATQLLAEVRVNEQLLTELHTQKARMEDTLRNATHGFVVVSDATPPEFAEKSKKKLLVAVGIPLALLFLALLFVIGRELKGMRIHTPREAAFWGRSPVVGMSIWPRDDQGIDELIADMDDFVPDAQGQMLVLGITENETPQAMQFAARLNSDWFDTTVVGGSLFDGPVEQEYPSLPAPGSNAIAPYDPGGGLGAVQHQLDPVGVPMSMRVEAWEGATAGPALRRAARLADRVCVIVRAQQTSGMLLKKLHSRLGRADGVGIVLVNVADQYADLPDRVGPVERFWLATRE